MECLGRYTFFVMTSAILSGGMKMRDEHGMLSEVHIYCHGFCHTFRWCENEGRAWNDLGGYTFLVMTSVSLIMTLVEMAVKTRLLSYFQVV